MTLLQAILLGLVQGATEFLPVSSSGHLLLLEHLWGVPESARLALTAALHVGTVLALLGYFARRIAGLVAGAFGRDPARRRSSLALFGMILLGSVPAAAVGFGLNDQVDAVFSRPVLAGAMLLVTGVLLLATRFARRPDRSLSWRMALVIGFAQAAAVLPGLSRSGATIGVALLLGLGAAEAFEFSFLLSIPAVLGAAAIEFVRLDWSLIDPGALIAGTAVALVAGLGALVLLRRVVLGQRLSLFAGYCWVVGVLVLMFVR